MRLQRGTPIAGVDPEIARRVARACHGCLTPTDTVAAILDLPVDVVAPMLDSLANAGFLEQELISHDEDPAWTTTIAGGALTMASFLKPITRAKAEKLLAGVIERAAAYNADDGKPYLITEIAAFGSYARPDVTELGDLDLMVKHAPRREEFNHPDVLRKYARASGRTFGTYLDSLFWPEKELLTTLRARSGYINLHTEDVSKFTDEIQVVYRHETAATASQDISPSS